MPTDLLRQVAFVSSHASLIAHRYHDCNFDVGEHQLISYYKKKIVCESESCRIAPKDKKEKKEQKGKEKKDHKEKKEQEKKAKSAILESGTDKKQYEVCDCSPVALTDIRKIVIGVFIAPVSSTLNVRRIVARNVKEFRTSRSPIYARIARPDGANRKRCG